MKRLIAMMWVVALLFACRADSAVGGRDSLVVLNSARSLERAVPWALTNEITIGAPAVQFGGIADIAVGGGGEIYALDSKDRSLRVFDTAGNLVRSIGRSGQGPGEFTAPVKLAAWSDTVAVFEIRKYHVFLRDGTPVKSATYVSNPDGGFSQGSGFILVDQARHTPRGVAIVIEVGDLGDKGAGPYHSTYVLRPFDVSTGVRGDSMANVPGVATWLLKKFMRKPLGAPEAQIAIGSDGNYFISAGDDYRVDVFSWDRARTKTIVGETKRLAVSEADLARSIDAELRDFEREHSPPRPQDSVVIEVLRTEAIKAGHAPHRGPVGRMLAGGDGSLLVERPDLDREIRTRWVLPAIPNDSDFPDPRASIDSTRWDLLGADGKIAGRIIVPPGVDPKVFTGTQLYCMGRDENHVPFVVRYGVARPR